MALQRHYQGPVGHRSFGLNIWDLSLLVLLFSILALLSWGANQLSTPYNLGTPLPISLDPTNLPYYAASSTLRMLIALLFSLIFTLIIGAMAAKSRQAERVLIPIVDILQSIPVLGFLSFTVLGFIHLFPGSLLGPQCAAIFAIFTAQVWNMILSFYGTLKLIPKELEEACAIFRLSKWRRFWQLEVPYCIPALIWNTMMSMSASWFFVVASEAISVKNQNIQLPGIGSYIGLAIDQANYKALFYAIIAMSMVILIYDQVLFRPLLAWSEKFRPSLEEEPSPEQESWLLNLLHRTRLIKWIWQHSLFLREQWLSLFSFPQLSINTTRHLEKTYQYFGWLLFIAAILALLPYVRDGLVLMKQSITCSEILQVFFLGGITLLKVTVLLALASMIWVPIGVWIGLRPHLTTIVQPIIQFLAAFPSNLFYPIFAIYILKFHLNPEIWTAPLMILGTQWYILFNVIAGTTVIPKELKLAAENYQLTGMVWWKRFIIPAIFPYYVTGSITAAGGCWNAAILADVVTWGEHRLEATGLGSYIVHASEQGDFIRLALGISVMCIYVSVINQVIWHKLYLFARERYQYG